MELLLNVNQYNYKEFLSSKVDVLVIALEDFSSGYNITYKLIDLPSIIEKIHLNNKKVYIALNIIANENCINKLNSFMNQIIDLKCDGFVVADFGVLQLFKENKLLHKVIFNPITTITNKYACLISNDLGIHHTCIANELNIKDILEILKYTKGNVEILAQGYYQICNSKRPLLSNFFKKFKIKKNSSYYYIKEESRDYAYPIIEIGGEIFVYIDKQRSVLPYLKELIEAKIQYLRIDTIFMSLEEIQLIIDIYSKAIIDTSLIPVLSEEVALKTNSNLKCLENISILKKEAKQ